MSQALSVGATGTSITTSGTSAQGNIPNAADGNLAKFCYVSCTNACHLRWGKGNQTAVATDLLLQPNAPQVINTTGADKLAAIQNAAGGTLIVTPLEWLR